METIIKKLLNLGYEVIRTIAQSSHRVVYQVRHISTDQCRIVKITLKIPCTPESNLREANILRSIRHRSIPMLYEYIEDDNFIILVEEMVCGVSLEALVLHQQLSLIQFNTICQELFLVFEFFHSQPLPLYYLDLKPEHIYVQESGIKIVDFDAARFRGDYSGEIRATTRFAPPELLCRDFSAEPATIDIFEIGRIMQFMSRHVDNRIINDDMRALIEKATAYEPTLRYSSVTEMQEDFQLALSSQI